MVRVRASIVMTTKLRNGDILASCTPVHSKAAQRQGYGRSADVANVAAGSYACCGSCG